MIFNIEQAACHGRGFNEGHANKGFLENFYNWITRAPQASPVAKVSGGPGWYIIDDQSAAVSNPYIVVSNHSAANVAANPNRADEPHKIFKVGMISTETGLIWISAYLWWNAATHTGYGLYSSHRLNTYDDADFTYDFRGGPNMMVIQTRRGATWNTVSLCEWIGDANLVEGTHVRGVLQAPVVAGNNVVINLAPGEAANFTEGSYYFLYDLNGHTWINYVKADEVDVYHDTITINHCNYNFPMGAVIGAYVHRFAILASETESAADRSVQRSEIPYYSMYGSEWYQGHNHPANNYIGGAIRLSHHADYLGSLSTAPGMSPNDLGQYAVERPGVCEYFHPGSSPFFLSSTGMNRGYGPLREVYLTGYGVGSSPMAANQDGRLINGVGYLFFQTLQYMTYSGSGTIAVLFPDYNSLA